MYRQKIQSDIARLKITSPTTKRNMLAGADEFEILVNEFLQSLRKGNQYATFITIEKGKAILSEQSKEQLHESFANYAQSDEQIKIYNAQMESAKALNELYTLVKENSDIIFILPVHFFNSFFDMQNDLITAKPVQFSNFNKK